MKFKSSMKFMEDNSMNLTPSAKRLLIRLCFESDEGLSLALAFLALLY